MKKNFTKLDISDYLTDEETIAEYLNTIIAENDQSLLLSAIGDIAKARGIKKIANDSGLGRESLYKALSPNAKPRFETIMKVIQALGIKVMLTKAEPLREKPLFPNFTK